MPTYLHKRSRSSWRSLLGMLIVALTAALPAVIQRSSCMMAAEIMPCCQVAPVVSMHAGGSPVIQATCDCGKAHWSTAEWFENRQVQSSANQEIIIPTFSVLATLISHPQQAFESSRIRTSAYPSSVRIHLRTLSIRC